MGNIHYYKFTNKNSYEITDDIIRDLYDVLKSNKNVRTYIKNIFEFKLSLLTFINKEKSRLFVIFVGPKAVGFTTGNVYGNKYYKLETIIHKKFQNRKLGTKLIARMLADMRLKEGITKFIKSSSTEREIKIINNKLCKRKSRSNMRYVTKDNLNIEVKSKKKLFRNIIKSIKH